MKKSVLLILLALSLCLSLCLTLASCGQKAVIKLVIDSGLAYEYELNESPNYPNVKATATYNDGEVKKLTSADLTFGDLDTSSQGTKTLTVTYDGFTIEINVTVKGASLSNNNGSGSGNGASGIGGGSLGNGGNGGNGGSAVGGDNSIAGGGNGGVVSGGGTITDDYFLVGAELPATIAAFKATAQQFTNKNVTYTVGDANPFTFRLALAVLDDNDELVTSVTRYNSISKVFLVDGATETQIGTEYVTVDEVNNTFDFTPAAVGKTFRIVTYPAEAALFDIVEESTRDLTVKIVEGYNVTDARELNLMTNTDVEMHEQYMDADVRDLPENWQGAIAQRYVDQQFGAGYYAQYGDINLKGFVLHCDLAPTVNDIPEAYITNKSADHDEGFDDSFAIYDRYIGGTSYVGDSYLNGRSVPNSFAIHGNCFTINTSGLPMMSDDPAITPGLTASNSWIFRFKNNVKYSDF